jgi:hypothetical protein
MTGRPSKLTPKVKSDVCDALKAGATHRMAADYAGIDVATLQRWLADPRPQFREFRDAVKGAEAKGDIMSLAVIQKAAQGGQWQAAAWLLERRHPDEYGRRQVVAVARADAPDVDAMEAAARRGVGVADASVLFQRQLAVLEAERIAGQLSAPAYLAAMDRLTNQATRLAELQVRSGGSDKGAPKVELTLRLDSMGISDPAPSPEGLALPAPAPGGGDLIEVG